MKFSQLRVIIELVKSPNFTSVLKEVHGNNHNVWKLNEFQVGRLTENFRVLFEIVPRTSKRGHISIDNLAMKFCLTAPDKRNDICKFQCDYLRRKDVCITNKKVCDIDVNCNSLEDEKANCGKFRIMHLYVVYINTNI